MMAGAADAFDRAALLLPLLSLPWLLLGILLWRRIPGLRRIIATPGFVRTATVIGWLALLLYGGQVAVYLAFPGYLDHDQTTIAKTSFLAIHGGEIYPAPDRDAIYGGPYGPLLYLLNGLGLWLQRTILGSKIAGVFALLLGLAAFRAAMRARLADEAAALLAVFTLIALMLPYGLFAYWNRAESFLLLAAALALAALRLRRGWAEVAVGLMLGFAAGIKLSGVLYLAPAVFGLLGRQPAMGSRSASLLAIGAGALVALFAPFLLPGISIESYGRYIAMAAGHGLDRVMLLSSLDLAAALLAPPAMLYVWRRGDAAGSDRWLFWGLLAAAVAVVLMAARVQAGAYHVLPLIPAALYATASLAADGSGGRMFPLPRPNLWAAGLLLALAVTWPGFLQNYAGLSVLEEVRDRAAMSEAMAELDNYAARHPGIQMAAGDDDGYWLAVQDAPLVFRSGRIAIDYAAWMDLVFAGADRDAATRFIDDCRVPVWVMPHDGEPFALRSLYDRKPLFTEDFRRRFAENYKEAEAGRFYRVWVCRKG